MRIRDVYPRSMPRKYTEIRPPSQWQAAVSVQGLLSFVSLLPSHRDSFPLLAKSARNGDQARTGVSWTIPTFSGTERLKKATVWCLLVPHSRHQKRGRAFPLDRLLDFTGIHKWRRGQSRRPGGAQLCGGLA